MKRTKTTRQPMAKLEPVGRKGKNKLYRPHYTSDRFGSGPSLPPSSIPSFPLLSSLLPDLASLDVEREGERGPPFRSFADAALIASRKSAAWEREGRGKEKSPGEEKLSTLYLYSSFLSLLPRFALIGSREERGRWVWGNFSALSAFPSFPSDILLLRL